MSKSIDDKELEYLLDRVTKPARYIGNEINEIIKDPGKDMLRMAFAFPDTYEIGMSYLGMQILYDICNRESDLYLERVFEPSPDMAELMRERNDRLFTLETKTFVNEMDVLGFTLQYEMSYTDVLDMLDLSGIPLFSSERTDSDPLIIAGGPCAFNPEPLAPFIDAFLIGDGEELLPEFLKRYKECRESGLDKEAIYKKLSELEGVYIPDLYDPGKDDVAKVRKAIVKDIDIASFPEKAIVPNIEAVHDRAVVESFRGCTRGCRFCQAGMIYRPVRERTRDTIFKLSEEAIKNTGHDELSLLSLSTSDHSDFENMAGDLVDKLSGMDVSLSLPSLRLDSFSFSVLEKIQKYKKSGLTFAVEAGSQRLRDVINKGVTEKDIYDACEQAIELGWRHIKLYFMIGLPTETYEDLDGIRDIAEHIVAIAREHGAKGAFSVTVNCSNFVPKPFTPFQWCAQDSLEELGKKREYLAKILKIKGVRFSCHDSFVSKVEAVLAKGDRRSSSIILKAFRLGCRLDGWSEYFDKDKWAEALSASEIPYEEYSDREIDVTEQLPWDFIDPCITKDYLIKEYERSMNAETTPDCRISCNNCGVNRIAKCFVKAV